MRLLQSFFIAISMYSKIPVPRAKWNQENMKYAMCFFPAVGVVTGLCEWLLGGALIKAPVGGLFFAAVMTLLPILISGGFHLDGFMDTMDALNSYGDREKKLAILKDSNSGAFAVLGLGCYLVWSLAVWSEVTQEMLGVIGCVYVISRAMSGFSIVTFTAARDSGLAKTFQSSAQKQAVRVTMILIFLAAAALMFFLNPVLAAGALITAVLVFIYYAFICRSKFGGVTGDLAGYFLQLCELGMLTGIILAGGVLWKSY